MEESSKSIKLKWSQTADDEKGFIIQREAAGDGFVEIARVGVDVETYTDSSVERGVKYAYRIIAYNDAGYSQPSNEADATLKLEKPLTLAASAPNDSEVNLSWQDKSLHESGFVIQYKKSAESDYAHAVTAAVNATGWSITGLSSETDYQFRIKAIGEKESDWSGIDDERTPAEPASMGAFDWSNGTENFYIGNESTEASISGLTSGKSYTATFTVMLVGTWDGDTTANGWGPDFFSFGANGSEISSGTFGSGVYTFSHTFAAQSGGETFTFESQLSMASDPDEVATLMVDPYNLDEGWRIANAVVRETMPTVSITATDAEAKEGDTANTAKFRITRTGSTSEALTVNLHPLAGSAEIGATKDYTTDLTDATSVTIPADEEYVDIVITARVDLEFEVDETIVLCVKADSSYRLADQYLATTTVLDIYKNLHDVRSYSDQIDGFDNYYLDGLDNHAGVRGNDGNFILIGTDSEGSLQTKFDMNTEGWPQEVKEGLQFAYENIYTNTTSAEGTGPDTSYPIVDSTWDGNRVYLDGRVPNDEKHPRRALKVGIVAGVDKDGDGELAGLEIVFEGRHLFRAVTPAIYSEAKTDLALVYAIGGPLAGYEYSSNWLYSFVTNQDFAEASSTSATVDSEDERLDHIVGAAFGSAGNSRKHTFTNANSDLPLTISSSSEFKSRYNGSFTKNKDELLDAARDLVDDFDDDGVSRQESEWIGPFTLVDTEGNAVTGMNFAEGDLHYALGHTGFESGQIWFKMFKDAFIDDGDGVNEPAGIGYSIGIADVHITGKMTDLYDFAFDGGDSDLATLAAAVQAGNVTLGTAGNVRLIEIDIDSYHELGYVKEEWFDETI